MGGYTLQSSTSDQTSASLDFANQFGGLNKTVTNGVDSRWLIGGAVIIAFLLLKKGK